jgi:phosphoribosylformylglycinamidine (FGAM) synthase PurS component
METPRVATFILQGNISITAAEEKLNQMHNAVLANPVGDEYKHDIDIGIS